MNSEDLEKAYEIEGENEINNAELNAAIEAEIFGAIPLTDAEWEVCKATHALCNGPQSAQNLHRLVKYPSGDEPDFYTKLHFNLAWPRDYARDSFHAAEYLVNKMRELGWLFDICDYQTSDNKIIKMAGFQRLNVRGEATAENDGLAIARAALIAVREWKKYLLAEEARKELANTL